MPRQLRLEYAGAIYHVMRRGNRRGLDRLRRASRAYIPRSMDR